MSATVTDIIHTSEGSLQRLQRDLATSLQNIPLITKVVIAIKHLTGSCCVVIKPSVHFFVSVFDPSSTVAGVYVLMRHPNSLWHTCELTGILRLTDKGEQAYTHFENHNKNDELEISIQMSKQLLKDATIFVPETALTASCTNCTSLTFPGRNSYDAEC